MILDENGKPVDIKPYDRNVATKLIEDFMLMANETVAEEYFWRELPFLYRTHEQPDEEKIRKLSTFINNFGYHIHVGNSEIRPKEVQKLLGKVEGTPQEPLISRLALRFDEAGKVYAREHRPLWPGSKILYPLYFPDPAVSGSADSPDYQREYPGQDGCAAGRALQYDSSGSGRQSSECERRAEEAERETVKLKKVEYMRDRIGEEFDGVISGLTKWGAYVELENTIEGLVHVTNMRDDHYDYREEQYELVGEHTRKVYKLGQKVRVRVLDADRLQRTIDFEFCEAEDL